MSIVVCFAAVEGSSQEQTMAEAADIVNKMAFKVLHLFVLPGEQLA